MRQSIIDLIKSKHCDQAKVAVKKSTFLEAIHLANKGWLSVFSKNIINCFKKGAFKEENETNENHSDESVEIEDTFVPPPVMPSNKFNKWLDIGDLFENNLTKMIYVMTTKVKAAIATMTMMFPSKLCQIRRCLP